MVDIDALDSDGNEWRVLRHLIVRSIAAMAAEFGMNVAAHEWRKPLLRDGAAVLIGRDATAPHDSARRH